MSILDTLNEEIENRINVMEEPGYDPGPPLNKVDYTLMIVIAIVSMIFIIMSAV